MSGADGEGPLAVAPSQSHKLLGPQTVKGSIWKSPGTTGADQFQNGCWSPYANQTGIAFFVGQNKVK